MRSYGELIGAGNTRHGLRRAIAAGELIPYGNGWYGTPQTPSAIAGPLRRGQVATCTTALEVHGLWIPSPLIDGRSHETGRRGMSAPASPEVVPHRPYLRVRAQEPVVGPVGALEHALRCHSAEVSAILLESALDRDLLSPDQVHEVLGGVTARRRRAIGRISRFSQSGTETRVRRHLARRGLLVREQVQVGPRIRVDLQVGTRLVIECDSAAYHVDPERYAADRRRDQELVRRGYVVLRLTWEDVMLRFERTCAVIDDVIARRAHLGTPIPW